MELIYYVGDGMFDGVGTKMTVIKFVGRMGCLDIAT